MNRGKVSSKVLLYFLMLMFLMFVIGCSKAEDALPVHSISGTVSGVGSSSVLITLSGNSSATTQTDTNGKYSFSGMVGGNYTVTPSLAGYMFNPMNTPVSLSGTTFTADHIDFTATATTTKTISGVAAAGAPIIGTVTIKDSTLPTSIERVTTIAADGSYSIDVSGMTAPFALRADGYVGGREYHLYSAAVSTDVNGTINITPFTDLIIANMAEEIAESYYNSGAFSAMTPAALAAAEAALQAKLQPILTALGVDAAIDLLRTSFNTDHTGLDAVIDVVKVTVDPATVKATLDNVVNGSSVTVDIAAGGTSTGTLTGTGVSGGVTAFQAIFTTWTTTFTNLFATGLPSEAALGALIADQNTFLESGQDRASWLTQMTTDDTMIGMKITSVNLVSLDEANGKATITITGTQGGRTMNGPDAGYCLMVKQGGNWLYAGDGRIADVRVRAHAQYTPYDQAHQISTGLELEIAAQYLAGAAVQSAVVTGPGLPVGGVILNKQINNDWFSISGGNTGNVYIMTDDTTIGAIPDNAVYIIKLYNTAGGGGNVLNGLGYTSTILKRPLKNSELSSASFPAITAPTVAALRAFNSGNLAVTWTLPAGLQSDWLQLQLASTNWTHTVNVESRLNATDTSKTLTVNAQSWTVANRQLWIDAGDTYDRRFQIGIW